jgi:hypothetical protein
MGGTIEFHDMMQRPNEGPWGLGGGASVYTWGSAYMGGGLPGRGQLRRATKVGLVRSRVWVSGEGEVGLGQGCN